MPRRKTPYAPLLKFVSENAHLSSIEIGRQFGMRPQTVVVTLHRAGFFKVWNKVQVPTNEGVRIR